MFLNILRISASDALKIFLNIIDSVEYAVVIFRRSLQLPTGSGTNTLYFNVWF